MARFSHDELEKPNWFDYADFYDVIAARSDFKVFVEVGSWKGHSIRHLARKLRAREARVEVYAVDLWDAGYLKQYDAHPYPDSDALYEMYCTNLVDAGVRDMVCDIRACSWESADRFADRSVDFAYIDADHAYDSVIRDIRAWTPKVRPGGIIAGHDYANYTGVRRAVEEVFNDRVRTCASAWYIDVDEEVAAGASLTPSSVEERIAYLERQRAGWLQMAQKSEAELNKLRENLAWTEKQRLAWLEAAGQKESAIVELQRDVARHETERTSWMQAVKQMEERLAAWRVVADERERALEEHERLAQWHDAQYDGLKATLEESKRVLDELRKQVGAVEVFSQRAAEAELRASRMTDRATAAEGLATRLTRDLDDAQRLEAAMRATFAWRAAEQLRRVFPNTSRRGRVVRRIMHIGPKANGDATS